MLVDLYAFHHVQLLLLLVFENLLLSCDFWKYNVLFELLLEDLQQFLDNSMLSSNLEVINMYRHDAQKSSSTTVIEA